MIKYPMSDLVTSSKSYVVGIEMPEVLRGKKVGIQGSIRRTDSSADAIELSADISLSENKSKATRQLEIVINTAALAAGEYAGELVVSAGKFRKTVPVSFFRMPDKQVGNMQFGVYAMVIPKTVDELDATLREIKASGIDLICQHMHGGVEATSWVFDRAARLGIQFRPSVGLPKVKWSKEVMAKFADPSFKDKRPQPCRNNPEVRKKATEYFAERLTGFMSHPGFSGTVYYGDDFFLPFRAQRGEASLTCYCDVCTKGFKAEYGIDPPTTTERKIGIIAEDDPWYRWMLYRCGTTYGVLANLLEEARKGAAADVEVGLCHGWPDNPFSSIVSGLYGPLTQPFPVVSSYCYPMLRSPAQDFICHYEIGKMGNRDKDVWMLGLCAADHTMAPRWQVYQNYWNMLAAGYKSMSFFSWWDFDKILPIATEDDLNRRKEAMDALAECGKHKDWIMPVARHWEDPPARNAALYSFATEAFDIAPEYRGHHHSKQICELYRLALRSEVPMKVICEEEVRNGILDEFDTLCLHDVRVMPSDIREIVEKYAASGKLVMQDSDELYTDSWHPNTKVNIKGTVELAPESMIELLRDRGGVSVEVDNPDVTMRRFTAGSAEYLVFVNNYADRYWGMTYTYGNRDANYELTDLVKDAPVSTSVRFAKKQRWLFDASTGERAGVTDKPLQMQLEPSWGRVLVVLPARSANLKVNCPRSVEQGGRLVCKLEMLGDGRRIRGTFAVKCAITSPSGRTSRHSGYFAINNGVGEFVLPIGINEEAGKWKIKFEGGFPRKTVTRSVTVRDAGAPVSILAVRSTT